MHHWRSFRTLKKMWVDRGTHVGLTSSVGTVVLYVCNLAESRSGWKLENWKNWRIWYKTSQWEVFLGARPTATPRNGKRDNIEGIMTIWWTSPPLILQIHSLHQVDRKKPPPPGGFPISYVPSSRTVSKMTTLKNLVQILRGRSSYSRFLMREHSK